jgi:hypothetical protein
MNSNDFEIVVIYRRYYALIFDNAWVNTKEDLHYKLVVWTNSNDIEIVVVVIIRYYFLILILDTAV